jgi:hypothetical protein
MTESPSKTTKAQAYKRYNANPAAEGFRMLWDMQERIPALVEEAVKRIESGARESVAREALSVLREVLGDHIPGMVAERVRETVGALRKAQDGRTPERGVDFWTSADKREIIRAVMDAVRLPKDGLDGRDGSDGATPEAGVDYLSESQVLELIEEAVSRASARLGPGESLTEEDVTAIASRTAATVAFSDHAAEIARALESLRGADRLDYDALKNRPGVKAYDDREGRGGMIRGGRGGTDPLYYDLTDLCDGVTKTFAIPANRRVLGVWGTQFPNAYRPAADWTSTTTSLTLTSQVSAPEQGQTLYILYSPL